MSNKHYISESGFAALNAEMEHLLTVERPRVVNNVAAAAAEGDRSENAEYIYGKKRLREIDRRVEFLSKRLDTLEVVPQPTETTKVRFLSWVEIEDDDGESAIYRIVGADETDAKAGWISWKSPIGRALLGKGVDEEVQVETPGGRRECLVLNIFNAAP